MPIVTVVALDLVQIVSGAVITETIFSWPGIGRLFVEAMDGRDYPVLMGLMMISSFTMVAANFAADMIYTLIDPRAPRMNQVFIPAAERPVRTWSGEVWHQFMRHRAAVVGLGVLLVLAFLSLCAPLISPYDFDAQDIELLGMPTAPSWAHWLGTDQLGRDSLTRLLYVGKSRFRSVSRRHSLPRQSARQLEPSRGSTADGRCASHARDGRAALDPAPPAHPSFIRIGASVGPGADPDHWCARLDVDRADRPQ